jgi:hypothetical protein
MADKGFNGTTVTFAGSGLTPLVSVRYQASAAKADVGGAADTDILYELARVKRTTTVTIKGATTIADGATGALVVAHNDGGSKGSIAAAIVTGTPVSGKLDGEITSTITFTDAG